MKKQLLALAVLLLSLTAHAQWVTIPDANFTAFLQQKYPTCMNGNQMDTTCAGIVNSSTVDCSYKQIVNLSGIEYFDNLDTLICYYNQLTALPPLPASLRSLNCGSNRLSFLPPFLPNLGTLICSDNALTSLPALPHSLTDLDCKGNQLTSLPALPDSLLLLGCYYNQLTSLPALPASLTLLGCGANYLTSLPALPPSLSHLACWDNELSSLPLLPGSLIELFCGQNKLSSLPSLPNSMWLLQCGGNLLTSLPALPASLIDLRCESNRLSSLPALPASLTLLFCNENQLTSLPALPVTLRNLDCGLNFLTSLPPLPYSMSVLYINNNNITCLPVLRKFTGRQNDISFIGTNIRCLSNVVEHNGYIREFDTNYPICDLANQNGCDIAWNIEGKVYHDQDSNCIMHTTETRITGPVKINLYQSGNIVQSVFSSYGSYSFDTDLDTYTLKVDTTVSFIFSCLSDTTLSVTSNDSLKRNVNFGIRCKPGFDIGVKSIFGNLFRPANNTRINIAAGDMSKLYGLNCATGVGGTVTLTITGPARYVGQANYAAIPSLVAGNVITWNVGDFAGWSFDSAFNIIIQTDTFAQAGQQVCFTVSVTPTAGDNNVSNNTLTHCFEVRTSYDPNDKQVYPLGSIDTGTKWLTYTVRFQNTGNDTAIHIYITDTLDNNLDVSTFDLLSSSHKNLTQLSGNIVRFNFPHIMLPDSNVNEPLSHGYVQYRIKVKENLPPGTQISNTAYIYFDFNAPVVTNTVTNRYCVSSLNQFSTAICAGEEYSFYGNELSSSGNYNHTLQNVFGCDSVIQLHLTVHPAISPTQQLQSICSGEKYSFYGTELTVEGDYNHVLQSVLGCDSVIGLNLTVHPAITPTQQLQSICSGEEYNFFGTPLNTAGSYSHTLQSATGCDSLIELSLSVTDLAVAISQLSIDSLRATGNGTVQWINCTTGQELSGQVQQVLVVNQSGSYAAVFSNSGCMDTTDCVVMVITGTGTSGADEAVVSLYPNPSADMVFVTVSGFNPQFTTLYDASGRKVSEQPYSASIDISRLANGVYIIELRNSNSSVRNRLVKM